MIEELSEENLNVYVGAIHGGTLPYIAHCLRLELIGEGQTRQEAISRLEKLINLQCRIHQSEGVSLWLPDIDTQWEEYHTTGLAKDRILAVQRPTNGETIQLCLSVRTGRGIIVNRDAWPLQCPLGTLRSLLAERDVSWVSHGPDYGRFIGPCTDALDGPLQSYPFYVPPDMSVRWYHLRSIARRFCLDDLQSVLTQRQ